MPSDKSSTRTGPGCTLRRASSSLAAAPGVRQRQRHEVQHAVRRRGGGRDTRPAARWQLRGSWTSPEAAAARRHAPRKERLARKEGATTTPVTSKWLAASGAPEDARRNSSALGHEPFDASPAAATARAGARLRAGDTRVSAVKACGVACVERTVKRQRSESGAARSCRLVQPPAAMRRRAWRQAGREGRAAVPLTLEAARRVRVVRPKVGVVRRTDTKWPKQRAVPARCQAAFGCCFARRVALEARARAAMPRRCDAPA